MGTLFNSRSLWTDAQQKRYFLIPEYASWPKGDFILRTFTGREQSIDPAGLSNFEMTPQQAQQYVQLQMNQALEQTKSAFADPSAGSGHAFGESRGNKQYQNGAHPV